MYREKRSNCLGYSRSEAVVIYSWICPSRLALAWRLSMLSKSIFPALEMIEKKMNPPKMIQPPTAISCQLGLFKRKPIRAIISRT